jgi:hypothetical protein
MAVVVGAIVVVDDVGDTVDVVVLGAVDDGTSPLSAALTGARSLPHAANARQPTTTGTRRCMPPVCRVRASSRRVVERMGLAL